MWDREEGERGERVASQVQSLPPFLPLPLPQRIWEGGEAEARRAIVQCSQRETLVKNMLEIVCFLDTASG